MVFLLGSYRVARVLLEFLQHWGLFHSSYKQLSITCIPKYLLICVVCNTGLQTWIGMHKTKFLLKTGVQVT